MSAFWSGHVGAAAGSCLGMLLSERCLRFGGGMLVPLQGVLLQGVGWGTACAFLERACWCRCRVLLAGAAVRVVCGLWSAGACKVRLQGAAPAGCCCWRGVCALEVVWRVLLQGAAVRVLAPLCALEVACWCRCMVPLLGAPVRVQCALWSWRAIAAAGCYFRGLLLARCVRCGAGLSVLVHAVCRCRMLLQGAAVRVVRAFWS